MALFLATAKILDAPEYISQACPIGTYFNSPERHKVRTANTVVLIRCAAVRTSIKNSSVIYHSVEVKLGNVSSRAVPASLGSIKVTKPFPGLYRGFSWSTIVDQHSRTLLQLEGNWSGEHLVIVVDQLHSSINFQSNPITGFPTHLKLKSPEFVR
jgi:hypothetical protein